MTSSIHFPLSGRSAERGVSIIEILVGILIGLIGTVVVFQVFSIAQGQRRTTSSGTDVQTSGNLAMYRLEGDLRHGGFGLGRMSTTTAGCMVSGSDALFPSSPAISFRLLPIDITDGGAGPDTIRTLIGSSGALTDRVVFDASLDSPPTKTLYSRAGFVDGDVLVGLNAVGTTCALIQVSSRPAPSVGVILHEAGGANGRFNAAVPPALGTSGSVLNLGTEPRLATWFIRGDSLMATNRFGTSAAEIDPAQGIEIASGALDLQAQYGVENLATGALDWFDAPLAAGTDWARVRAVRFAVLIRGQQLEKTDVTTIAPQWVAAGRTFALADADWKRYRYRVYESNVPLRNVIWGK